MRTPHSNRQPGSRNARRPHGRKIVGQMLLGTLLALAGTTAKAEADVVVHEWGTFTSIQDVEGQFLRWNGVQPEELPEFVYNWTRPGLNRVAAGPFGPFGLLSKQTYSGLQRMETPVLYFYANEPMQVNVSVEFPEGYITEWFPQASVVGPSYRHASAPTGLPDQPTAPVHEGLGPYLADLATAQRVTNRIIQWRDVQVLGPSASRTASMRRMPEATGSHYFEARATEANLLKVAPLEAPVVEAEVERFLFYRGVGDFESPLELRLNDQNLVVINRGPGLLKHLVALTVDKGTLRVAFMDQLPSLATNRFAGGQAFDLADGLTHMSHKLEEALISEGLYAPEAAAMVATWKSAWLTEPGTRILYILPRQWTERVLPIQIQPEPTQLVRVMVGRAEVITPAMEAEVCQCVNLFLEGDEISREAAMARFRTMELGRFAQPAIELVIRRANEGAFTKAAWGLLRATQHLDRLESDGQTAEGSTGRQAPNRG